MTGGDPSLTIETDDNLMEYLEVSVSGSTLTLQTVGDGAFDIEPTASIIWRVTVPNLAAVTISGAGSIDVPGPKGDQIDATVGAVPGFLAKMVMQETAGGTVGVVVMINVGCSLNCDVTWQDQHWVPLRALLLAEARNMLDST